VHGSPRWRSEVPRISRPLAVFRRRAVHLGGPSRLYGDTLGLASRAEVGLTPRPQFRLRVGEVRIFYDVSGKTVEILAVVLKSEAGVWLRRVGESR